MSCGNNKVANYQEIIIKYEGNLRSTRLNKKKPKQFKKKISLSLNTVFFQLH